MLSFLDKLADDLILEQKGDLSSLCLIFPTRRAGLYFKKRYAERLKKPAWAPAVFSIEDFVQAYSPWQVGDELDLVFELFEVYRNYFPGETFSTFYPWGVMLLRDFSEIDSSLADGKKLLMSVGDLKEIDEQFGISGEDHEGVREFWKIFFHQAPGAIRKSFHENWKHLEQIYGRFREKIISAGSVYYGLAVRAVAEAAADGKLVTGYSRHVFAGFYSLSRAEEKIIAAFLQSGSGAVYYDTDRYYTEDPVQEAGSFIRKNPLLKKEYRWKEDLLSTDAKQIEMIGVPLQVLQSRVAGQIIENLPHDMEVLNKTAVVLPDENLLMPVLYSLPAHVEDLNVTMGYPLQASPLFSLVESLFELRRSFRNDSYFFSHVVSVLSHPYIRFIDAEAIQAWIERFNADPSLRLSRSDLTTDKVPEPFRQLFMPYDSLGEALNYFSTVLSMLIDAIRKDKSSLHAMEKEYVYYFYTRLRKLEEILLRNATQVTVEMFHALFKEVIRSTRIPFTGEPLKGLQVMGFLETRVLDFENLIILSMNEDILPPAEHHASFIPYPIRKSFGLPTYEDHNSIAAYHFYRLLQRAKNIYLVYNTEVKSFSGGEKSRFLLQVENELVRRNPAISFHSRTVPVRLVQPDIRPVVIPKTEEVIEELNTYFKPLTQPLKYSRKFSASALATYLSCPLRFYFQYVARLKEPEEQEEYIAGSMLGTILHEAMHTIYQPHQIIMKAEFEKLAGQVSKVVTEAIRKEFGPLESLDGKNILMQHVLEEMVRWILDYDKKTELEVLSLEQEYSFPVELSRGNKVNLYGRIDRVDRVDGFVRIVDYKTGMKDASIAKDIESLFRSPKYKEQFQAFFYALLLKMNHKEFAIKAGLFRMRYVSEGIQFVNGGQPIADDQFSEFLERTRELLKEIFDPKVPFAQTQDTSRCAYCAYKDICNR